MVTFRTCSELCQGTNFLNVANLNENSVVRITTAFYELLQGSAKYGLGAKSCLLPVFVIKVLLEHSQTCSFTYCAWLLSSYNSSTEELHKIQLRAAAPRICTLWASQNVRQFRSYSEGLVGKKLKRHTGIITDKTNTVFFKMETK